MNRFFHYKKAFTITALIIFFTGSLFIFVINKVDAVKQVNSPPVTPDASALDDLKDLEEDFATQEILSPTKTDKKTYFKSGERTDIPSELLAAAQQFLQEGWLHFIKEYASDTDQGSMGWFEDGTVLPAQHFWECWLHLNSFGQITDSICIQTDLSGSIIQVGVRSGNIGWNSATDEIQYPETANPQFNTEIDSFLNMSERSNVDLLSEEILDDREEKLYQLSYTITEPNPILIWGYNHPVTAWQYIYTFDPETGSLLSSCHIVTFEDGNQRLIEQVIVKTFEFVEGPSAEAEYYLLELENRQ